MSKENNVQKPLLFENHKKPVTRRDFLAAGLIQSAAAVMLPTVFGRIMSSTPAYAATCPGGGMNSLIPFLLFDCAGGAALSGNWLVGKQGGPQDFLSAYDRMGVAMTPQAGQAIDSQFGVPMYTDLSMIRAGIVANASPEALANLRMGTICVASQDDTSNNELSPLLLVSKASGAGRHVHTGLGTRQSLTGGNSKSPMPDPAMKPLQIGSVTSLLTALSYGAALDSMSVNQRTALSKALLNLSSTQAQKVGRMTMGEQFQHLINCGYLKNMDYVNAATAVNDVDPRLNAEAQSVYGITAASTGAVTTQPTIVYNVLKKNTGPGVITFGGCDYHDGTQTTGDAKDLEIGTAIGRAVEMAKRMGVPLFFAVISDGSVSSDVGTRVWRGDAGSMGMMAMGYYLPSGAPNQIRLQIGNFKDGQGVDRNTYIGNSPRKAAFAVLANYLSACGQVGAFSNLVESRDFETNRIDAHLVFG